MHMSNDDDQTHCSNLDCVSRLEIGQAGYLLKDPRSMFHDFGFGYNSFQNSNFSCFPTLMH